MGIQPSASRTSLLLLCPRPFDPEIEADPDIPGEPARYGSAFHQILAACLRSSAKKPLEEKSAGQYTREVDKAAAAFDVKGASAELAGHVKSSARVLRKWLAREKLEVSEIERAYAIEPRPNGAWGARAVPPHDEDHRYKLTAGEIGATVDLIACSSNRKRQVVIDHKTGWESEGFAQPLTIPQMRTLGLVVPTYGGVSAEIGIFHADRHGLPSMYVDPYERDEQRRHASELHAAICRIGQGFLRPGPHCARCHAQETCPARAADILAEGTAALVHSANTLALEPIDGALAPATGASVELRAGALYELLKKFRALEKAGSEEIKRLVRAGAIIETRDGKVLTIQTQNYETLSKKSVLEALGKVAGEKELERLRKKGAIREATREMLKGE